MSNRKDKKGSKSQAPAVMSPFMIVTPEMMGQWQSQMANMSNVTSTSTPMKAATVSKPPWACSDSSSSDEDFQPSGKKPKLYSSQMVHTPSKEPSQSQAPKRKVGRPKKAETVQRQASAADLKIVNNYPPVSVLNDNFAQSKKEECKGCHLWKGEFAVFPCGHAWYCNYCISKLRDEAVQLKRPAKCPCDSCYTLVTSWFKLINISP